MISSKSDLLFYMEADLMARGWEKRVPIKERIFSFFVPSPWKFQRLLRKAEYYCNVGTVLSKKTLGNLFKLLSFRYGAKCGYTVPLNVFGPGLCLVHTGTIVISGRARFGSNVRIHVCVNVGAYSKFDENWIEDSAPKFGNNIFIGPGAKIYGPIEIGDNVAIGANAVINKSVPAHCTCAGVNTIVNATGSIDMLKYGDCTFTPEESYVLHTKAK